jgi:hypothetical protein
MTIVAQNNSVIFPLPDIMDDNPKVWEIWNGLFVL